MAVPKKWTIVQQATDPLDPIRTVYKTASGKLQYIYHPYWILLTKILKYKKIKVLCGKINKFKPTSVSHTKQHMLHNMIYLVLHTCIRMGNVDSGVSKDDHVGLVALTKKHLVVRNGGVKLEFTGKSGVKHCIGVTDVHCQKFLSYVAKSPGIHLFMYKRPGISGFSRVTADDLNTYIKSVWGGAYSCKDIRTCQANMRVVTELMSCRAKSRDAIRRAHESAASLLGHSVSISKKNYICPGVVQMYRGDSELFLRARSSSKLLKLCIDCYLKN